MNVLWKIQSIDNYLSKHGCHPERREGSLEREVFPKEILRFAQDDGYVCNPILFTCSIYSIYFYSYLLYGLC